MKALFDLPSNRRRRGPVAKVLRLLGGLLLALTVYLFVFAVAGLLTRSRYPQAAPPGPGVVRGIFHAHTIASDGRGTVEDLARAAKDSGNRFVIITDHNVEMPPPPRYVDGVLMVFGNELSTPAGHLVALGASRGLLPVERQTAPLSKVAELGGFTIISHPVQAKNGWLDWSAARRAAGLELFSADTMLRLALADPFLRLAPALGSYFVHRKHALMTMVQAQPEAHARLLSLSQDTPRIGLCSSDAHGIPPYKDVFSVMSMYIPSPQPLSQNPAEASHFVLEAIRAGRSYCVLQALGEGSGFTLEGLVGEVRQAKVGEVLKVRIPPSTFQTQLRVYGPAAVQPDEKSVVLQRPGAVQIEVWALAPGRFFKSEWKPWLVPSPVWVYAGDADRFESDVNLPSQGTP